MISEYQAKRYCCEDISKIENYDKAVADKTQTWDCHHRLEIQGQFTNSVELLKRCGMYYNVPASQLIFLTKTEHNNLHNVGIHNPNIGRPCSEETRRKIGHANSQKKYSEEEKKKRSERMVKWWSENKEAREKARQRMYERMRKRKMLKSANF